MRMLPTSVLVPPARDTRSVLRLVLVGTLALGCGAAWYYHAAGLTLSHYDAKAHLVVARRVIDNLTPGWRQLGAVWLPLPHLLNLLPVQVDAFYRTGASGVAISVVAFALAALGVARIVVRATGSAIAAALAASIVALNPDLLYLQSTPMTEALLVAVMVFATSFTWDWVEAQRTETAGPSTAMARDRGSASRRAGFVLAAACLTRYEAWPLTGALLVLAAVSLWRSDIGGREALQRTSRLAIYPAIAVAAFLLQGWLVEGRWFVTDGFFVPDNIDTGKPFHAIGSVWWGAHLITGYGVLFFAAASALVIAVVALRDRRRASLLVLLALFAVGSLPSYAFFKGHPFRIRYMTPLVPALAVAAGIGTGLLRGRVRYLAAAALLCVIAVTTRPFDPGAPMVLEAQWDSGNAAARRQVTRYLAAHWNRRPILASMQSLAHYMQELSAVSLRLGDFVHEGNGDLWKATLRNPGKHVDWILIEEWAEGGDELAARSRQDRQFLRGFTRVAEGGGVALYRKSD